MNPTPACPVCGAAQPDWLLCEQCTTDITAALDLVVPAPGERHPVLPWESTPGSWAGIEAELTITLSRQGKTGPSTGGASTTTPLPYDEAASTRLDHLRATLASWCRDISTGNDWPADTLPAIAAWLLQRIESIRGHVAAEQVHTDIVNAVRRCMSGVDHPPKQPAALDPEARDRLLTAAVDALASRSEILDALPMYGLQVSQTRFSKWLERNRLVAHGVTTQGHPAYKLGDVLELARRN